MEVGSDNPHLFDAFRYLMAEKAGLYRQIIETFDLARQRFQLHLRPSEVLAACDVSACDENDIHQALQQLREWGNLDRHIDTAAVQTVEQFNRPRYLFSMTPAGVAAYEAMVAFERRLAQRGKLDTTALGDVRERLMGLDTVLYATPPDLGQAGLHMQALVSEFEKLATEAQVFLQSLHQSIDLQAMEVHLFIAYKEKLLDYLRNFIHELTLVTSEVVPVLDRLTLQRVQPVLDRLASKDIASEAPGKNTGHGTQAKAVERWENRWRGVCGWFLPIENQRAQAAVLRERARAAIPALLEAVTQINERRVNRSDRTADFRALAHWFLECPSDEEAHRLWLAAFSLSPCRHLQVDPTTLEEREQAPVPPKTSWLDAPALRLSPRLRKTGRHTRRGRIKKVIDCRAEQVNLRLAAEQEALQIEQARQALLTDRPIRLSDFERLAPKTFGLLLDLLGHAVASQTAPGDPAEATSSDGGLSIHLQPLGQETRATLQTSWGTLRGRDCLVSIRETHATGVSDDA